MKKLAALAALALICGCTTDAQLARVSTDDWHGYIGRKIDCEAKVVCWILDDHGISCLPLKDTALTCPTPEKP